MSAILVTSNGKIQVQNDGIRVGDAGEDCCCDQPEQPEDPGTPPNRDPTDPTGSAGCACFQQYSAILVTLAGLTNCTPQKQLYNCAPGGPVEAVLVATQLPQGTWSVPVTYSPANSQVGYTNEDVILANLPGAFEVRSTDNTVYSSGGLRLRLQFGRVKACHDKFLTAAILLEPTQVIVTNKDAFNNQRGDFGLNCADPNGSPDTRQNNTSYASWSVACTVACVAPLTCADVRLPATCPDPPNTVDGTLFAGGTATFTAV